MVLDTVSDAFSTALGRQRQQYFSEFDDSLVYSASYRRARITKTLFKKKQNKKPKSNQLNNQTKPSQANSNNKNKEKEKGRKEGREGGREGEVYPSIHPLLAAYGRSNR